jgi:hypothetical protein
MTANFLLIEPPRMVDPFSKAAYDFAVLEHERKIAPVVHRLEALNEPLLVAATGDRAGLGRLRTMRVLLTSGLFDPDFYREKYPDIREAGVDPLAHYVEHGDREGRAPNPAFLPTYYRREFMAGDAAGQNALLHYIEMGERSGAKPNIAFDPLAYLARYKGLAEFVDRPLFHYLKIAEPAGYTWCGGSSLMILPALEYIEEVTAGGLEEHYLLMKAKQSLVAGLGVVEGFATYRRLIDRPDHAELHRRQLVSLSEGSRQRAATFRETAPAGERFVAPQPAIIGEGSHPPLEGCTRSLFVACLIDARVRAHSNLVEVGDIALLDYEGQELARIDDPLDFDPAVFHASGEAAWIMTPNGECDQIQIEEAFTLLGIYTDAFGHWMIEYLPKYIAATLSGALPHVPVLIDADMPKTHRQALELLLAEGIDIIELPPFSTARVRRLWCAPTLGYFPVFRIYTERFKWDYFVMPSARSIPVIREIARLIEHEIAPPTGVERVYLAREPLQHHKLVNHEAIEAAAASRGFHIVLPQRLDFVEQARLLRHARYVVGPDGSQMFLAFFCRPGTKLCHLSDTDGVAEIQAEHFPLYSDFGIDYTVLSGPCVRRQIDEPWESDYEIDEKAFCQFLDQWLEP